MREQYPNDADGDAIRRVAECGSDMSRPMLINFQVAIPTEEAAEELAGIARVLGFLVSVYDNPECTLPWTCECSKQMLATYDGILAVQKELANISRPFGGFPDGWGTFGNGPNNTPQEGRD